MGEMWSYEDAACFCSCCLPAAWVAEEEPLKHEACASVMDTLLLAAEASNLMSYWSPTDCAWPKSDAREAS